MLTPDDKVGIGVMTPGEKKCMEEINTPHGKWWAPFIWFSTLITQLRREGHSKDDVLFKTLLDELYKYRDGLGTLYGYDWICVPLVYTQVTTLAVYTYFLGSVIGQQFLDPEMKYPGHAVDLYVPVFTLLQFFFYMGWLKVAEQMINPFGEDDDDFDTNWIIDRNFQVSLIVVDDMYGRLPPMEKDVFWDEEAPTNLPYTKSSLGSFIAEPFMGSTANLSINGSSAKFVDPMETIPEIQVTESMAQSRQSIMSSPAYTRRIHSNLLTSLKSQLIGSKATLDNLKVNSEDVTAEPTPLSSPVHTRRSLHRTLLNRLSSQLDSSKGNLKQGADCKYPGSVPISRSNIPRVHSCIEDFMENNSSFYRDDGNLYSDGERSGPGMGKPSVSSEFINRIRANSFTRRRVEETIKAAKSQRNNLENPPLPPVQSQPVSQDTTQGILSHSGHEQCKLPAEKSSTVPDEEVKPINTTTDITNTVYSVPTTQPEVKYHHTEDGYMYEVPSSDQSTVNSLTPLLQNCQTSSEEDIAEELLTVVTVL